MAKLRLTVLFLLALMLVVAVSLLHTRHAYAQEGEPTIPKSYGVCKGAAGVNGLLLIFEDKDGTIRLVSTASGKLQRTYTRR